MFHGGPPPGTKSRALGNVSRAALDFFVEKMLLGPSHGTQALSECQTIFSDDFGTLKNDLKKSFGPRASYLGDHFFRGHRVSRFRDFWVRFSYK